MRVTRVLVRLESTTRSTPDGYRLISLATVDLDNEMVLTHIRVLQTPDNRFMIAWPSRIGPNNRYVDVCYPKTESLRNEIRQRVIDETNLELSRASKE